MLHLRGFHEQAEQLSRAASAKGVVTNLDAPLGPSDSDDDYDGLSSGSELSAISAEEFFATSLDDALHATEGNNDAAALLIQKQYREHLAWVQEQNEQHAAAAKIQARQRGKMGRKRMQQTREKQHSSAAKIQARQRGRQERRLRREKDRAARIIQRRARGNSARNQYRRQLANAKAALRHFRGRICTQVFDNWADIAALMVASRRVSTDLLDTMYGGAIDAVLAAEAEERLLKEKEEAEATAAAIAAAAAAEAAAAEQARIEAESLRDGTVADNDMMSMFGEVEDMDEQAAVTAFREKLLLERPDLRHLDRQAELASRLWLFVMRRRNQADFGKTSKIPPHVAMRATTTKRKSRGLWAKLLGKRPQKPPPRQPGVLVRLFGAGRALSVTVLKVRICPMNIGLAALCDIHRFWLIEPTLKQFYLNFAR
eukprot:SAG31_NODE_472_length_15237_cov_3.424891_10_plen_428_part_00